MTTISLTTMSNRELIDTTIGAARAERSCTCELLALLGELDARKLYLTEGCSSLFAYCTRVLHLSEHAAYHRIEVSRAARQFPLILTLVAEGVVTLTTVALLRTHLTPENHEAVLAAARHKSKREVEEQIARLAPRPDAKTLIKRLPEGKPEATGLLASVDCAGTEAVGTKPVPASAATSLPLRPAVAPLAPDRYLLRVTLSGEAHANLRRAQDLMRHTNPSGDPAVVIERAQKRRGFRMLGQGRGRAR